MNRARSFIGRVILFFVPLQIFPSLNRWLFRFMGHSIGKNTLIYSSTQIVGMVKVFIGANSFVGHNCLFMGNHSNITIGENCDISSCVSIITGTHNLGNENRRAGFGFCKDITIGSGSWIGFGVTLINGACIGKGTVVAAGSVVTKNFPDNVMIGGVPAKIIKSL